MYFFERNDEFRNRIMCVDDDGVEHSYEEMWDAGDEAVAEIPAGSLTLLQCSNNVKSLASYLALLRKGCPVILLGSDMEQGLVDRMVETYHPGFIINVPTGTVPVGTMFPPEPSPWEHLALLLSTSGSTGDRKLVRLSRENLQSNCDSIVEYLGLTADERPITTLPMEYTYGLSVIHSHLAVGATIILTDRTLFNGEFWDMVKEQRVTSMAGVPYTYAMFDRLKLTEMDLPHLKTMTQAGGHLSPELQEKYAQWAKDTGRRFFVMYGQTEATARMSYVPPEMCLEKPGSIGIPIPGGRIEIEEDGRIITEPGVNGELVYYGPNVSMGYATCAEDLAKPDDNNGRLETGDIGYKDEDGYLYITGRKKRFIKLQGKRISLDQIQDTLQTEFETDAIVCTGKDDMGLTVWVADEDAEDEAILSTFADKWSIRDRMVEIRHIDKIPRNPSGKVIYKELKDE